MTRLALALTLTGCLAGPDALCEDRCVSLGRGTGCYDNFKCVCLVVEGDAGWDGECSEEAGEDD